MQWSFWNMWGFPLRQGPLPVSLTQWHRRGRAPPSLQAALDPDSGTDSQDLDLQDWISAEGEEEGPPASAGLLVFLPG